jgi:hypothetical protein
MTEAVVLLAVAEAATITARFPELKFAASRDVIPNEKSPAYIAMPAKNRFGMMEDSKDEKILAGAGCTPSVLPLIMSNPTHSTWSTSAKMPLLFCNNMMAIILPWQYYLYYIYQRFKSD